MPQSELRLIKRCAEFIPQERTKFVPRRRRGIYVLYCHCRKRGKDKFDVVYVGMAGTGRRGGIRGRLESHFKKKGNLWAHFSAFEVWDNVRNEEIAELEGMFRHIYRRDTHANSLNVQRGFKKLRKLRVDDFADWE